MPLVRVFDPNEHNGDFEVRLDPAGDTVEGCGEGVRLSVAHAREQALYAALEELRWHVSEVETLIKLGRHNVEV